MYIYKHGGEAARVGGVGIDGPRGTPVWTPFWRLLVKVAQKGVHEDHRCPHTPHVQPAPILYIYIYIYIYRYIYDPQQNKTSPLGMSTASRP